MMEEQYAFCAGQCRASRLPPASCRCICQGLNHGILYRQHGRPINVTPSGHDQRYENWMNRFAEPAPTPQIAPLPLLPHIPNRGLENATSIRARPLPNSQTDIYPVGSALKKFVKKITGIRSQDDLNNAILKGMRTQFNQANTEAAIDQAFTIRQSRQPDANRPELYELYETGEIDQALEMMGKRWVIGRPKVRR